MNPTIDLVYTEKHNGMIMSIIIKVMIMDDNNNFSTIIPL